MKYNVWATIEIANEETDSYIDMKEEQIMFGSFKTLKEAQDCLENIGQFTVQNNLEDTDG
tara:strand:+ start:136 stop:315 length:180 start_codon:yes stop_codon:yes gene_type:complete